MEEETTSLRESFDFREIPSWYPVCVNGECPKRELCMRYQAVRHAPAEIRARLSLLPSAWETMGHACDYYDEIRLVKVARGFTKLYDQVLKRDYTAMRKELVGYFHGRRQYYWYLRGERPLSPAQQDYLRQWLRGWGYEWELPFDSYEETYLYTYKDFA